MTDSQTAKSLIPLRGGSGFVGLGGLLLGSYRSAIIVHFLAPPATATIQVPHY